MKKTGSKTVAFALAAFAFLATAQAGRAQHITVTPKVAAVTIYPGQKNVPLSVTVNSTDYAGPITVTLTGLPSGISVTPVILSPGQSGTLKLSATVAAGQEGFSDHIIQTPLSWTASVNVVGAAGGKTGAAKLPLTISISNSAFVPEPSAINLPIVKIDTGGKPIVNKTANIAGTITITSPDGQKTYLPNSDDTDNTATFHLHGNTTAAMPKKPYHVKLGTSVDLLEAMGYDCGYLSSKGKPACDKSKSYDLLANWDDKTFLRDWAASALANSIPIGGDYLNSPANSPTPSGSSTLMPWAPHSLFVELWINGEYLGNYQLIEEVKVDGGRVNINELADTDTKDDITGGYLLEIDERQDEDYVFKTPTGVPIGLIDPDYLPEVPEQTEYITNYVNKAENALYSKTYTNPKTGWRAYWDEASAINFYIVNDLMGNTDGGDFFSSDYLYKSQDNPLLHMGPIWDFDISTGNTNAEGVASPTTKWMQNTAWYKQWFTDPGFKADVTKQWNTLKTNGVFTTWINSIQQQAAALEKSQANNFGRWPMQGIKVWPNLEAAGSYDGEVSYMTNYLAARLGFLDSELNSKAATQTTLATPQPTAYAGAPVTLTATVTGGSSPTGLVTFQYGNAVIGNAPLSGGTATFVTGSLPIGQDGLRAFYNGDNNNALSIGHGKSITILNPLAATVVSLEGPLLSSNSDAHAEFTAAVIPSSGTAVPTGDITFVLDHGKGTLEKLTANGHAGFNASGLSNGTHTLAVNYAGDANSASSKVTLTFKFPPAAVAPAFSRAGGTYSAAIKVALTDATSSATIYYTTNGSTPTTASKKYSGAIDVSASETITAIAVAPGYATSAVTSAAYTIK